MGFLFDSILSALALLWSMDPELWRIVKVSLVVSGSSTIISSVFGVPLGFWVALSEFKGKRAVITVLNSLLALPTVVVGLFVYAFISRRGIFGPWDLLYTKRAMVMGQVILVLPLVATFTMAAVQKVDGRFRLTAMTLGANRWQTAGALAIEARFGLAAAVIAAFGRVIAEVGVSMMLGGNVKGFTRNITTAMALEYDKGQFVLAVALGLVLLGLAFLVNVALNAIQGRAPR